MVTLDMIGFIIELALLYWAYRKLSEYFGERSVLKEQLEEERIIRISLEEEIQKVKEALRRAENTVRELTTEKEQCELWDDAQRRKEERNRILRYGTIEELRAWRKAQ